MARVARWVVVVPLVLLIASALLQPHGAAGAPAAIAPARSAVSVLAAVESAIPGPISPVHACLNAECGRGVQVASDSATPLVRGLALGTTPTNWLVANWSGEGMLAENPANPLNLVAGSLYQAPSAFNNTTAYYHDGDSGAYASFDGGRTWTDQTLPPMPDWSNKSSPNCGQIHLADSAVAFGPNNMVYYVDLSYPGAPTYYNCQSYAGGLQMQVTSSSDGGRSWNTPVSLGGGYVGSVDKPWIAVDPVSGEVYVAYTDDGSGSQIYLQHSNDSGVTWSNQVLVSSGADSMRGVELSVDPWRGVDAVWVDQGTAAVQFARSTDYGTTFSSPKTIATGIASQASPAPDGFRAYLLPGLGVDEYSSNAYTGRIFAVWQNGSGGVVGDPKISLSYSSDNGTKWKAPITVNSDKKFEGFQPDVAVGPDGAVYVEWYAENATSGHYNLLGAVSHSGGAHFDPEIRISDSDSYPHYAYGGYAWWIGDYTSVIADASGARPLWTDARATQEWSCSPCLWSYDYNISMYTALIVNVSLSANVPVNLSLNGTVRPNGTLPIGPTPSYGDWLGGQTYSIHAPATTVVDGTTRYFAKWFGSNFTSSPYLNGTVAQGAEWHACYTDFPGEACHAPGAPGYLSVSVVPGTAQLRVDGLAVALANASVNLTLGSGNHTVNLSAPNYYSVDEPVLVTPGNLTRVQIGLIGYPGFILGTVTPTKAVVRLDGTTVPVAFNGSFSARANFGNHSLSASLYGYDSYLNSTVRVPANASTVVTIALHRQSGVLQGSVSPINASVTVNGVVVNVTGGSFSVNRTFGTYWVNASAAGYDPATSGLVLLPPLGTATVPLVLNRSTGFLFGNVYPLDARLSIAGTTVPVGLGSFQQTIDTGNYTLNASAPGFDPRNYSVAIASGAGTQLTIALRPSPSWIAGSVRPAVGANLTLDGTPVALGPGGTFNVTVTSGEHTLDASAPEYGANSTVVRADPGHTSHVTISLTALSTSSGSNPLALGVGIGVAVVAVAAAVVVLRRRRRSP